MNSASGPPDQVKTSHFVPIFMVRDMRAALEHYERLGFQGEPYQDGTEYAFLSFGSAELHLHHKADHDPETMGSAAFLRVDDVDALERRWSASGVSGTSDPYDTAYGMREAVHIDPDNNLIRIGAPLERR